MAGKKRFNKIIKGQDYSIMIVKYKDKELNVLIDNEDVNKIVDIGSWHAIKDDTLKETSYYIANRYNSKSRGKGVIKLHRFITNCPLDKVVDHINHNTLDNRKSNLRICSRFENQQNLRSCKSGHPGVYFKKTRGKWVGNISKNNKKYYKEFSNIEDAISWRKQKEYELYLKGVVCCG